MLTEVTINVQILRKNEHELFKIKIKTYIDSE